MLVTENLEKVRAAVARSGDDKEIRRQPADVRKAIFEAARQLVRRAQEIVHAGWCQGGGATDINGVSCNFNDPAACNFCAYVAVQKGRDERLKIEASDASVEGKAARWVETVLTALVAPPKWVYEDSADYDVSDLFAWNDAEGRTKNDVERLFYHARTMIDIELESGWNGVRSVAWIGEAMNSNAAETDLSSIDFRGQLAVRERVLAVIDTALDLLKPDGCWITGHAARNSEGKDCGYDAPEACSWCAAGSVWKSNRSVVERLGLKGDNEMAEGWVIQALCAAVTSREMVPLGGKYEQSTLFYWNDAPGRKKEEVLKAFYNVQEVAEFKVREARELFRE